MESEINNVVQQKKAALAKSQEKIDAAKYALVGKQKALEKLEAEHERKAADLARMKELAKSHGVMQERNDWLKARMTQMFSEHEWSDGKLQDNPEYQAIKAEQAELAPKLEVILPELKKIYYGKG